MFQALDIPAWISDRPFVDAFYICACPAYELVAHEFTNVIALSNEPVLYRDIVQREKIQQDRSGSSIQIIKPDFDPVLIGVSYETATETGLKKVVQHGALKGRNFLKASLMS
jgi:hypothetical protein